MQSNNDKIFNKDIPRWIEWWMQFALSKTAIGYTFVILICDVYIGGPVCGHCIMSGYLSYPKLAKTLPTSFEVLGDVDFVSHAKCNANTSCIHEWSMRT